MDSICPELAHDRRKNAPARPRGVGLHRRSWRFEKFVKNPLHCFSVSLTSAQRPLHFQFFTTRDPRSWMAIGWALMSSYWPEYATASALAWLTLNLTPNNRFPSINCKVRALNHTAHGDSAINGQTETFSVILQALTQLDGSRSIKGTSEYWNKGTEGVNGPVARWPQRAHSVRCSRPIWGKTQIGEL
jgi:hypothetical protein